MPVELLRAGSDEIAPLVCVHPVDGDIAAYRPLAAALTWPGPIVGIRAPRPAPEPLDLGVLAASYVDELSVGPVVLLGWSLGGVIAAAMSSVVAARGGEVAYLGIVDSRAPLGEMRTRPTDRDTLARGYVGRRAMILEVPVPQLSASDPEAILAALRAIGAADDLPDAGAVERELQVFMALTRGFFRHEQQPVPVPVQLFDAQQAHPLHPKPASLGWEPLAPRVDKHPVPGTHFTAIAPQHVPVIAPAIARTLPDPALCRTVKS
jgi:thioesterase domain-containing protein